jgi:hypothetical protein
VTRDEKEDVEQSLRKLEGKTHSLAVRLRAIEVEVVVLKAKLKAERGEGCSA